jgi:hypothetical protein
LGNILFGSGIMVCLLLKIMDENKWWENWDSAPLFKC